VKKVGDEFDRDGYSWQAFNMCNSQGVKKNGMYHFCCMGCGDYLRAPLNQKFTFPTKHTHIPLEQNSEKNIAVDVKNIEENEAPFVLLYNLIKFVCHSNLSFIQASSEFLLALVREAIVLAHLFPNLTPEELFPEITAAKLSEDVRFMGYNKNIINLESLKDQQVSILMDAGKSFCFFFCWLFLYTFFVKKIFLVLNRHYVVVLLCRIGAKKPFIYYDFHSYEKSMDKQGYARIAADASVRLNIVCVFFFLLNGMSIFSVWCSCRYICVGFTAVSGCGIKRI
jgi:hypothetical protein